MTIFPNTIKLFPILFFILAFFLPENYCNATEKKQEFFIYGTNDVLEYTNFEIGELNSDSRPYPVLQLIRARQKKNKKITAAVLAFPFPFGIVGLHRIYLGTAPHVPVVYIGTLGGVLGILPFIDFCVLVLDKDIDRFINNPKVLMWVDENKNAAK